MSDVSSTHSGVRCVSSASPPSQPIVDGPADPVERLFASYRAAFVRYERRPTVDRWRVTMTAFTTFNSAYIAECEDVAE